MKTTTCEKKAFAHLNAMGIKKIYPEFDVSCIQSDCFSKIVVNIPTIVILSLGDQEIYLQTIAHLVAKTSFVFCRKPNEIFEHSMFMFRREKTPLTGDIIRFVGESNSRRDGIASLKCTVTLERPGKLLIGIGHSDIHFAKNIAEHLKSRNPRRRTASGPPDVDLNAMLPMGVKRFFNDFSGPYTADSDSDSEDDDDDEEGEWLDEGRQRIGTITKARDTRKRNCQLVEKEVPPSKRTKNQEKANKVNDIGITPSAENGDHVGFLNEEKQQKEPEAPIFQATEIQGTIVSKRGPGSGGYNFVIVNAPGTSNISAVFQKMFGDDDISPARSRFDRLPFAHQNKRIIEFSVLNKNEADRIRQKIQFSNWINLFASLYETSSVKPFVWTKMDVRLVMKAMIIARRLSLYGEGEGTQLHREICSRARLKESLNDISTMRLITEVVDDFGKKLINSLKESNVKK